MKKVLLSATAVSMAFTAVFVMLYAISRAPLCLTLLITGAVTAYHLIMRMFVGAACSRLMRGKVDFRKSRYAPRAFEVKLYQKLGVKRWKSKLPTYDPAEFNFSAHTVEEILCASCQAETVHTVIVLLSFLPLFAVPALGSPAAFLLTSLAAAAFDALFILIQRYNRPRLLALWERRSNAVINNIRR